MLTNLGEWTLEGGWSDLPFNTLTPPELTLISPPASFGELITYPPLLTQSSKPQESLLKILGDTWNNLKSPVETFLQFYTISKQPETESPQRLLESQGLSAAAIEQSLSPKETYSQPAITVQKIAPYAIPIAVGLAVLAGIILITRE